jgi:hypothetical protein
VSAAQQHLDDELPGIQQGDPAAGAVIAQALSMLPGPGPKLLERPVLRVPHGRWTLADPGDGVCLRLAVPALIDWQGSAVEIPNGTTGLLMETGAKRSSVERLCLASVDASQSHGGVGLHCQAHGVRLRDVTAREQGTGFFVDGSGPNANAQRWRDGFAFKCWGTGLHLKGGDANAGLFSGFEFVGGQRGILDESFLGNAHRGHDFTATAGPAVEITNPANYSTFEGCYVEMSCASEFGTPIESQPKVTWIGGGAIPYVLTGDRVGQGRCRLAFRDNLKDPSVGIVEVVLPFGKSDAAMRVQRRTGGQIVDRYDLGWGSGPEWKGV